MGRKRNKAAAALVREPQPVPMHPFIRRVEPEPEHDKPHLMRAFDELVSGPVDSIHIERMDDGCYWMAISKGGERQTVTFGSKGLIVARTERE